MDFCFVIAPGKPLNASPQRSDVSTLFASAQRTFFGALTGYDVKSALRLGIFLRGPSSETVRHVPHLFRAKSVLRSGASLRGPSSEGTSRPVPISFFSQERSWEKLQKLVLFLSGL